MTGDSDEIIERDLSIDELIAETKEEDNYLRNRIVKLQFKRTHLKKQLKKRNDKIRNKTYNNNHEINKLQEKNEGLTYQNNELNFEVSKIYTELHKVKLQREMLIQIINDKNKQIDILRIELSEK